MVILRVLLAELIQLLSPRVFFPMTVGAGNSGANAPPIEDHLRLDGNHIEQRWKTNDSIMTFF